MFPRAKISLVDSVGVVKVNRVIVQQCVSGNV